MIFSYPPGRRIFEGSTPPRCARPNISPEEPDSRSSFGEDTRMENHMDTSWLGDVWPQAREVGSYIAAGSALAFLVRGLALAFFRHPKSTGNEIGAYFTESNLLRPPLTRPAYSDRMAYALAEMSDLAYYQFEGRCGLVDNAIEEALELDLTNNVTLRQFLDRFSTELLGGRGLSESLLRQLLGNSGFTLLGVINVDETQGFICKREVDGEPPYVVIAFRGTEKKVSDWLTDARCVPTVEGRAKVHTGFLEAFTKKHDDAGRTVKDVVEQVLAHQDARDGDELLPLYITGHSLGGALALLSTKLVAPNVNGACYTFGAPRIGNYEYFRNIKTPVYRVVNSADLVPRVPPGAVHDCIEGRCPGDVVVDRLHACSRTALRQNRRADGWPQGLSATTATCAI